MKRKIPMLLCAAVLSASFMTACATDKKYTEEEYSANYDTGYQAGYDAGVKEGVEEDRARQVQTMNYETFRVLNQQTPLTGIIYIGRAACPYCGAVTDYMRSLTDLQIPVYYVSLEPYYNSPYYDDFKEELGIDSVPTFIYYKDGTPNYYMDSPVIPGYFDLSGQDRVDGYNQMVERINTFIEGCAKGDPAAIETIWPEANSKKAEDAETDAANAETAADETATGTQGSASSTADTIADGSAETQEKSSAEVDAAADTAAEDAGETAEAETEAPSND